MTLDQRDISICKLCKLAKAKKKKKKINVVFPLIRLTLILANLGNVISGKQGFLIFYFRKTRISNILFPENKDVKYFLSGKQAVIKKSLDHSGSA